MEYKNLGLCITGKKKGNIKSRPLALHQMVCLFKALIVFFLCGKKSSIQCCNALVAHYLIFMRIRWLGSQILHMTHA